MKNPNFNPDDLFNSEKTADVHKDFKNYSVMSIEDPFDYDEWEACTKIISDTKHPGCLRRYFGYLFQESTKGIALKATTTLLFKVQIGSITE